MIIAALGVLMIWISARGPAAAALPLYSFKKGYVQYTISKNLEVLTLNTGGVSYHVHRDGCAGRQIRELEVTSKLQFFRMKKVRATSSREGATIKAFGQIRQPGPPLFNQNPGRHFDLLPKRFINLSIQELNQCLIITH